MPKNIVLLSDGTGNRGGVGYESNVWRLYQALQHHERQICCYGDGVGSQDFKPIRAIAGAFGIGLSRNVRELYGFLVRHWEPGDRIYLFGFSRGAFTVRMLTGLIVHCGLPNLASIDSEARLDRLVRAAYCAYRRHQLAPQFTERFREIYARKDTDDAKSGRVPVHFVGVWDTVDAMGVPFDELREAWDQVTHYSFRDRVLSGHVAHGCHALSIDDARRTFHPLMWDERLEDASDRIEQVWFAGVHANVGGGYPKPQMALVTLNWMIDRVRQFDERSISNASERLCFHAHSLAAIQQAADPHGRLYDSRTGFGAFYRYAPRDLETIRAGYTNGDVKVHTSAMARVRMATDRYAPHTLTECADQIRKAAGSLANTADWRDAMDRCASITWLRQLIYFAILLTLALPLIRETLGIMGIAVDSGSTGLPAWIKGALAAEWSRWGALGMLVLLVIWRQRLKGWQQVLASAGWETLFPHHRPSAGSTIAKAKASRVLKVSDRIRLSKVGKVTTALIHGIIVRLLAIIAYPFLKAGGRIHSAWCLRGPEHATLSKPIVLEAGESRSLVFETHEFAFETGLQFEAHARYAISVEKWSGWADADYPATPKGLIAKGLRARLPPPLRVAKLIFRLRDRPVFELLARIGSERPIPIGEAAEISSTHGGHLQLFVNDADLRIPLLRDLFYCNNRGVARIRVKCLSRGGEGQGIKGGNQGQGGQVSHRTSGGPGGKGRGSERSVRGGQVSHVTEVSRGRCLST